MVQFGIPKRPKWTPSACATRGCHGHVTVTVRATRLGDLKATFGRDQAPRALVRPARRGPLSTPRQAKTRRPPEDLCLRFFYTCEAHTIQFLQWKKNENFGSMGFFLKKIPKWGTTHPPTLDLKKLRQAWPVEVGQVDRLRLVRPGLPGPPPRHGRLDRHYGRVRVSRLAWRLKRCLALDFSSVFWKVTDTSRWNDLFVQIGCFETKPSFKNKE